MLANKLLGAALAAQPVFIEDTFSTYLYAGNSSTQTITNGIDLSGKGGLVWIKQRTANATSASHQLTDTNRGVRATIFSNSTSASDTNSTYRLTAFNNNGFSVNDNGAFGTNISGETYVSWTFRKQAKFFDVVTYTGNGSNRTIAHNLGSTPGFLIVKRTDSADEWYCYHRAFTADNVIYLNLNNGTGLRTDIWNSTAPTSTVFSLGTNVGVNASGGSYVAYLFGHDAGGFGAAGADNVITCGSYTGNGSATGPTVTLGYEPQWVMIKKSSAAGTNWEIIDSMRGFTVGSAGDSSLRANLSDAEITATEYISPTATGFNVTTSAGAVNTSGDTYIYIAIRRGPMKTPTSGTSVFSPVTRTGTGAIANVNCGFAPDMVGLAEYPAAIQTGQKGFTDKLRGGTKVVYSSNTTGELASGDITQFQNNGVTFRAGGDYNVLNALYINWFFQRAPGFFDIVCYTGTGSNTTQTHNLAVVPELILVKGRSASTAWQVYSSALANTEYLVFNTTAAKATGATRWNSTTPTSSVFSLGTASEVNTSAATYMAYLFATVAGVSKVGSYTGTGTTLQVNCGFTAGARFVMIKRTDSTGDWYVWDSARGIVAGNDPYLLLNSTAAEVTNTDYVDTSNAGFEISSTAPAAINANGGTFIFLAIA